MPIAVFIDTSVYFSHQFHFANSRFKTLLTLAQHGHVVLLTTDITVREIHANLDKVFDQKLGEINKALADGGILRRAKTFSLASVHPPLQEQEARDELHAEADAFFQQDGVLVLSTKSISSGRILDQYFSSEPPFGDGKKKSEFPDAFAAAAVLDWATENHVKVQVVAEDGDWKNMCATSTLLIHDFSLAAVVERLLQEQSNAGVLRAHALIIEFQSDLINSVKEELVNEWAYLEDVEGDVHSIEPSEVQLITSRVVSVEGDLASVELELIIEASFEIAYDDPDSWIYDSEEKIAHYMRRIETTLERSLYLEAEVVLNIDPQEESSLDVTKIVLNRGKRIGVLVEEYPDHMD